MARAERALVRVRHVLPAPARARRVAVARDVGARRRRSAPPIAASSNSIRLRYRLLPYVYSLAGAVTQDSRHDAAPAGHGFPDRRQGPRDQRPVHVRPRAAGEPGDRLQGAQPIGLSARRADWYDFWTGAAPPAVRPIDAPAPYDSIPVHVRAGSIIPSGPELQYTTKSPPTRSRSTSTPAPTARFTLYEDDGPTFGYEKGARHAIPFTWNDATRTLTIGARRGPSPAWPRAARSPSSSSIAIIPPAPVVPLLVDARRPMTGTL